jgi:LPXTG-motif cell wall-anchored protein
MAPCATYNREDEPDPPLCDWFDNPAVPAGRQAAANEEPVAGGGDGGASGPAPGAGGPGSGENTGTAPTTPVANSRSLPATGAAWLPAVAGLVLGGAVLGLRRRARTAQ